MMQSIAERLRGAVAGVTALATVISTATPAAAQGLPLIRDTEIETIVRAVR